MPKAVDRDDGHAGATAGGAHSGMDLARCQRTAVVGEQPRVRLTDNAATADVLANRNQQGVRDVNLPRAAELRRSHFKVTTAHVLHLTPDAQHFTEGIKVANLHTRDL